MLTAPSTFPALRLPAPSPFPSSTTEFFSSSSKCGSRPRNPHEHGRFSGKPIRVVTCISTRPRRKAARRSDDGPEEARQLVRVLLKKAGEEKQPLVSTLKKFVRVVRTEHCFLLFEELGRKDRWLQCLEVGCIVQNSPKSGTTKGMCIATCKPLQGPAKFLVRVTSDRKESVKSVAKVFRWMQKQRWYIADNGIYSKLISVMGKKGQTRMAMWLFSEMRNSSCRPDTSVYNALITAHLHSRDKVKALCKASGYFDKMKTIDRCQPNIVTYNILLRAYAQAGDTKQVEALFKDLETSTVSPGTYTYNGVMDAYGKNGMLKEMESILLKMKSNQCKPDVITFNVLIDSYGKRQAFEKMEQVFKSLLRSKEKPTLPTFNSMIINYGKARLRDKAESIFKKMNELGYKPSFVTYESMITTYGYCDCASRAREIFDEMFGSQNKVEVSTLNAMLNVYCINGLPTEADQLLDLVIRKGLLPNASTYMLLYKAYAKANSKDLILKLLKCMDEKGIVPNKNFFLEALEGITFSKGRETNSNVDGASSPSMAVVARISESLDGSACSPNMAD